MENLNCAGIYKITCSGNNKFYIGSSVNIKNRFNTHLYDLRLNKHHSRYLQNCYNKYGKESLVFEVIEFLTDTSNMLTLEYSLIQSLNPEFNSLKTTDVTTNSRSSEYGKKVSTIQRNRARTQTSGNITGVTGVTFSPTKNRFAAYITLKDVKIALGSYISLEEAINARQEGERIYWSSDYENLTDKEKSLVRERNKLLLRTTRNKSGYKNISYYSREDRYVVEVKCKTLGSFKTLEEALELRDSCFPKLPDNLKHLTMNL